MEPEEKTLATIPEEEEDGDTAMPDVRTTLNQQQKPTLRTRAMPLTRTRTLTQKMKQNRTWSFKP